MWENQILLFDTNICFFILSLAASLCSSDNLLGLR